VRVDGGEPAPAEPGTFYRIEREWAGTTQVTLLLPMTSRASRRYNETIAIERGPLVYALPIGERWQRVHDNEPFRELPHGDWEIHPTTPWNYALAIDETTLAADLTFVERPVSMPPFSPDGAPVVARARGRRLPGWQMENGSAADAPVSPVSSAEPLEDLALIPYGCTNLRITEFPVLARKAD
jgi:hypothetical protein